ncbi:hypothetical protein [Aeromicrobium sp. UC242_57]|uniref:hypothetical protein n=1 Tax=Aeromicrobium sp. UC242_57 TaxID=3374624 RepID=UPI0037AE4FA8
MWSSAELALKVKEPIAEEYGRMRADQTLFTYLHLAASRPCTDALLASGTTSIAYETGAAARPVTSSARADVRGRGTSGAAGRIPAPHGQQRRTRRAARRRSWRLPRRRRRDPVPESPASTPPGRPRHGRTR